jgi:hypothetical protein
MKTKLNRLLLITMAGLFLVTGFCFLVSVAYADITEGLIGYWKFDEGTGTLANDSSGKGYHGTLKAAVWNKDSKGSALYLDGTTSYVDFGDIMNDLQPPFSISVWVYSINPAGWPPTPIFGSDKDPDNQKDDYYGFVLQNYANTPFIGYGNGGYYEGNRREKYSAVQLPLNQWVNIVGVQGSSGYEPLH